MKLASLWELQLLELKKAEEEQRQQETSLKELKVERKNILAHGEKLAVAKENWQGLRREIRREGSNLGELEDQKKELEEQLYGGNLRNPKELSYLEEQVENMDVQINLSLERVLELEEKGEEMEKSIISEEKKLSRDRQDFNHRAKIAKEAWDLRKNRLAELNLQIKELETQIEAQLLQQYRRLQERLGIGVVVGTEQGICGGCRIHMPSHVYQRVRMGQFIQCENCGRILISRDA